MDHAVGMIALISQPVSAGLVRFPPIFSIGPRHGCYNQAEGYNVDLGANRQHGDCMEYVSSNYSASAAEETINLTVCLLL